VPAKDGSVQTLLAFESEHADDGPKVIEFKSSENVFQAAKARRRGDALFVVSLSPGDAARAGQGRLRMNRKVATIYREQFGGSPVEIEHDRWRIRAGDMRYEKRAKWKEYKLEIMLYALQRKFDAHYELIREYVECDVPVFFVEHTLNDSQWADGHHGDGTNYLGKMLTALAWRYRTKENVDCIDEQFLEWLRVGNAELIENGKEFYAQNANCPWLR